MRAALRETHGEDRARALGAVDLNRAALQLDEFLHERKADADALAGPAGITLIEAVEDVRELIARDAGARVRDNDFGRILRDGAADADGDGAAARRELERVGEQVVDDLLDHLAIEIQRDALAAVFPAQLDALLFGRRREREHERLERAPEIAFHRLQPHRPRFDLRQVEQLRNQLEQIFRVTTNHQEFRPCVTPCDASDASVERVCIPRCIPRVDFTAVCRPLCTLLRRWRCQRPAVLRVQVLQHLADRRQDQRERRAEFVRNVGEEARFHAIELAQLLQLAVLDVALHRAVHASELHLPEADHRAEQEQPIGCVRPPASIPRTKHREREDGVASDHAARVAGAHVEAIVAGGEVGVAPAGFFRPYGPIAVEAFEKRLELATIRIVEPRRRIFEVQ